MARTDDRLDAFVDAAFAFGLTLLVAGAARGDGAGETVRQAVAGLPAFAFGFAMLAMFWWEHVCWRRLAGAGRRAGVVLSLALVFVLLIFVLVLSPMAAATAAFVLGAGDGVADRDLPLLFRVYGAGFALLATLTMALHLTAARGPSRPEARGRAGIHGLLATVATLSIVLAAIPRTAPIAAFAYVLLPVVVPLFAWFHRWVDAPGQPRSARTASITQPSSISDPPTGASAASERSMPSPSP